MVKHSRERMIKALVDFDKRLLVYTASIDEAVPALLPAETGLQKRVAEAMRYSMLSSGKRLRGTLLLACYAMFKLDFTPALPFAAAVEMIHAYSLIHDDLPCMDDDDIRRGKPSCHVVYGEATALLAGDGLLTLAFETISKLENAAVFGAEKTLEAVRILSRAAGADGMVGGQVMDLENDGRMASLETLMQTDDKKTGALIMAACDIGCMLGGADEKIRAAVAEYASKLGLAFQITDDVLDVKGDPKKLGKPVGSDSKTNKATYASLFGLERAEQTVKQLTHDAVGIISSTGLNVEFLCALAEKLAGRER